MPPDAAVTATVIVQIDKMPLDPPLSEIEPEPGVVPVSEPPQPLLCAGSACDYESRREAIGKANTAYKQSQ